MSSSTEMNCTHGGGARTEGDGAAATTEVAEITRRVGADTAAAAAETTGDHQSAIAETTPQQETSPADKRTTDSSVAPETDLTVTPTAADNQQQQQQTPSSGNSRSQKSKKRQNQKTFSLFDMFDNHKGIGSWADAALTPQFEKQPSTLSAQQVYWFFSLFLCVWKLPGKLGSRTVVVRQRFSLFWISHASGFFRVLTVWKMKSSLRCAVFLCFCAVLLCALNH
ncbi:unnamed protein product [Gongylonema pulchrum]|uniref:Uncharacterized protein n=1 Tax=Gongylonema pulchrum TaxID=637853 RepID=A0A183DLH3_9BILA|nr:unnamed protein product [Gongylonema pulchrum]